MRQLQQWWRGKGHDFGGDLEMMNWEERNLRLVCSSETGRNHQVSKASKHLKTDSYLSSYFPFLKRKITTWGKKSENICSNKKQPKPEISTCKGHTCFAIRDTEKRLSLKIYKELPEGLEAFIQRKKMGGEGKAERIVRKHKNMPKPCPTVSEEELSHLRTVQRLRTPTAKSMHLTRFTRNLLALGQQF